MVIFEKRALAGRAMLVTARAAIWYDIVRRMMVTTEGKPALAPALVEEFVGVAHGGLPRVQELLAQEPQLVNAAWDWGGGDWETALGAAAHMGRRDIADILLSAGARLDIFAAAMLGYLDVVRAITVACPAARLQPGPHGIPLLAHAVAGGEVAAAVADYLRALPEDTVA
jgi:hypothetical protein